MSTLGGLFLTFGQCGFKGIYGLFVVLEDKMGLRDKNFMLVLFFGNLFESEIYLFLLDFGFFYFLDSLCLHSLEVVHHLYLLLEGCHLDFDLYGFLFELGIVEGFGCN